MDDGRHHCEGGGPYCVGGQKQMEMKKKSKGFQRENLELDYWPTPLTFISKKNIP